MSATVKEERRKLEMMNGHIAIKSLITIFQIVHGIGNIVHWMVVGPRTVSPRSEA
jgi:hypothetical protein